MISHQEHHHIPNHEHPDHKDKKHNPATFKQIDIDDVTVRRHFDLVLPLCVQQHKGKFQHAKLQHMYAEKCAKHDWFYWAHVQTKDQGKFYNWTVVFEVKEHKVTLCCIHEGHRTFF